MEVNLKEIEKDIYDVDAWLDETYGAQGTPEREAFTREAYAYNMGQLLCETRKREKITQSELAKKIGANKSYISKIENGLVEPGIGLFAQIIEALGLRIEITKPVMSL